MSRTAVHPTANVERCVVRRGLDATPEASQVYLAVQDPSGLVKVEKQSLRDETRGFVTYVCPQKSPRDQTPGRNPLPWGRETRDRATRPSPPPTATSPEVLQGPRRLLWQATRLRWPAGRPALLARRLPGSPAHSPAPRGAHAGPRTSLHCITPHEVSGSP